MAELGLLPFSSRRWRYFILNSKDLVSAVSNETKVPAAKVRRVVNAVLTQFAELIDNQDKFVSSIITLQGVTLPAKEASGDKPARPERKIARMKRRTK
jgi:hypothetical protein